MKQTIPNRSKQQSIGRCVGVKQAETMTSISAWTWRRWAYAGKVASVKLGDRLLIPVSEIDRVVSEGYRPALETEPAQ